ncbi:SIS domain-containing protein [Lichenicoccus roseus]|uniref:Glutamine--fructose-6-phosphate aminotransferase [isomerizing] n=1 Tax=Lichenicoccus roseus TaxID=2683649 RepID=A0A5R9JDF0_9PROT|nr:SIS domain-containing protein [Lichenicoccus roseus]TLU74577.1 SIS domain-containing protein [Lichenicoccus roseus]
MTTPLTPLLADTSPLDDHARALIAGLFEKEAQLMASLPTDDPRDPKRLRRVMLTRTEMFAQPEAITNTLTREAGAIEAVARDLAGRAIRRVVLTGCGDSLAVMIGTRLLLEEMLGVVCEPMQALDFAYYHNRDLGPETLVVTLSSSGTTTRTVEAALVANALGARTLALSNTPGSALMTHSTHGLLVHAERKGWPTQSSTAAMAMLCRLAIRVGMLRGVPGAPALQAALDRLPRQMADALAALDPVMAELARIEADRGMYLYAGGGPAYASALFGAVKMKECSPDHAMAIPLEEFHHYNSLKPDDPLFVLAPDGPSVARARDTAFEGQRWRGRVYGVVTGEQAALDPFCDRVIRLGAVPESLAAFTFTLPLQLFAYHAAMEKFIRAGTTIPAQPE